MQRHDRLPRAALAERADSLYEELDETVRHALLDDETLGVHAGLPNLDIASGITPLIVDSLADRSTACFIGDCSRYSLMRLEQKGIAEA